MSTWMILRVLASLMAKASIPGIDEEDLRRNWLSTSSIPIDTARPFFRSILLICTLLVMSGSAMIAFTRMRGLSEA